MGGPSGTNAVLYALSTMTAMYAPNEWRRVCTLPCTRNVLPGDEFKIGGPVRESRSFRLPEGARVAHVNVVTGMSRDLAFLLLGSGALAAVIGTVVSAVAFTSEICLFCDHPVDHTLGDVGGGILFGGLLTAAAGGIWALAERSHRTNVSFGEQAQDADPPAEDVTGGPY